MGAKGSRGRRRGRKTQSRPAVSVCGVANADLLYTRTWNCPWQLTIEVPDNSGLPPAISQFIQKSPVTGRGQGKALASSMNVRRNQGPALSSPRPHDHGSTQGSVFNAPGPHCLPSAH